MSGFQFPNAPVPNNQQPSSPMPSQYQPPPYPNPYAPVPPQFQRPTGYGYPTSPMPVPPRRRRGAIAVIAGLLAVVVLVGVVLVLHNNSGIGVNSTNITVSGFFSGSFTQTSRCTVSSQPAPLNIALLVGFTGSDSQGNLLRMEADIGNFQGPGSFTLSSDLSQEVEIDRLSALEVWDTSSAAEQGQTPGSVVINADRKSGSMNVTLAVLTGSNNAFLTAKGSFTCQTVF